MPEIRFPLGLVVEKSASDNPWIDHSWKAVTILTSLPEAPAWTELAAFKGADGLQKNQYYLGQADLILSTLDTAYYRDNLSSGTPKLWIVMCEGLEPPLALLTITANPTEGEANTEAGNNIVDMLDMPPEIAAFLAEYIRDHHIERPFIKRKRDKLDLDALAQGKPATRESGAYDV